MTTATIPASELRSLIRVEVPRAWLLNANVKLHWRRKGERAAWLRQAAGLDAARFRRTLTRPTPIQERVHCVVMVSWPDRRRRDVHNLMPTVKPCIDGIVDAGVLADDSDQHLLGPDLRVTDELCAPDLACVLTFALVEV